MNYYSYVVEHDWGLAPNPFGGYCSLTVCKPQIRKSNNLQIGDWIIGTGSKALEVVFGRRMPTHLIYSMQVSEIISIEDYWNDSRFKCKKPILNGSRQLMYGDNFYHKDQKGKWVQEDSAHSNQDGTPNLSNLKTDTNGHNSIISNNFYYFGQSAPVLPEYLHDILHTGIGQKLIREEQGAEFVNWLSSHFVSGIHGKPINWVVYNQLRLF
jgi:hypothetical protein